MRVPALTPCFESRNRLHIARSHELIIAGSTGSIGCSTLDIVRTHREQFTVYALIAGKNTELLSKQAYEFSPKIVVLVDTTGPDPQVPAGTAVLRGEEAVSAVCGFHEGDTLVAAIVGMAGLRSVLAGISAGKKIALANKESLVAGADLVRSALNKHPQASLIPVDSEHAALFQCLLGISRNDVASLVLTASGGPFRELPQEQFAQVTPAQAVKHPRWNMGAKISIDSATLVNKALELIEACVLYGLPEHEIEVLIHPQSIVHSLVRTRDGGMLAQLSNPDMKGPIAHALTWPDEMLSDITPRLSLASLQTLSFFELDGARFPAVALARAAYRQSSSMTALYNIANEVAVAAFLAGTITFDRIVPTIELALARYSSDRYDSLESLMTAQRERSDELSRALAE
jgi:1-deoxy-D-xylulose-5-phosphate reductoisomerase